MLGGALVFTGGALKAGWKVLWALTQVNHTWMSDGLFWWLGSGFVLLAGVGLSMLRRDRGMEAGPALPTAIVVGMALLGSAAAGWLPAKGVTLGLLVLANLTVMICMVVLCRRHRFTLAAWALVLNIVLTFVLSGLARIPDQTAPLQWLAQSLNLFAQGGFAFAMWTLWRRRFASPNNSEGNAS